MGWSAHPEAGGAEEQTATVEQSVTLNAQDVVPLNRLCSSWASGSRHMDGATGAVAESMQEVPAGGAASLVYTLRPLECLAAP